MKLISITTLFILFCLSAFAQRQVILPVDSPDWQVLHSLDNQDLGIDPALNDPDFNSTWMTLGLADSLYDGPAFTPGQTAPFRVTGIDSGIGGTFLTNPGENRSGAVYLVKEITGPLMGAWSLDFNVTTPRAYRIYLNGELIVDDLGLNQPGNNWDIYWDIQLRQKSRKPAVLLPGKNILAISLHPRNQNEPSLDFDLGLTALTDFGELSEMSPLADPTIGDSTTAIQWITSTSSATSLRYGTTRDRMTNSVTLPTSTFVHIVHLPTPPPGQRLYYEILKPDGSSFDPPSINSFKATSQFIIPLNSDWFYLNPRDPVTNASVDPAILDPDFYQTWSTQSIGTFPGNNTYDGPAFNTPSPAPFGPESANTRTPITLPGAVWFLKEVDGGQTGYHQLNLFSNGETSVTVFLNGNKIGEAYTQASSQAIWSQPKGTLNRSSRIPLSTNLILPPGRNLLAVQMHQSGDSDQDTFDLSLSGLPLAATSSLPFPIKTTSTSADLTWATSEAQSTRLRWGLALSSLTESAQVVGDRSYHTHTLPGLIPSTTYFVEILDSAGNSHSPATLSSFRTKDHLIFDRQSSGWSILESISNGAFVDPAATDPDFLATWFNPTTYDGPPFTPNQSAPFSSQDHHLRIGQTTLQTIDTKIRPVWLLKEFDGGDTGYQFLTLDATFNRGFAAYLNGQLILIPYLGNIAPFGSWNLNADVNLNGNVNFAFRIPESINVNPGPNILAIALHPQHFEDNGRLTGEFELRGVPSKLSISQPTIQYLSTTQVALTWSTTQLTSTKLSYGLNPLSPDQVIEDPEFKTNHQIVSNEFVEGGTYIFEILATDALGNTATSVGSFEVFPQVMRLPFLQKAAPTSMTVNWRTRDHGETLLRFGQDPANLDQIISGTNALAPLTFNTGPNTRITDHTVTVTGLTPATKYYYQIAKENSPAPADDLDQFFTTPPLPGTPAKTRIWVVGDSGSPGQNVLDVKDAYLQYTAETPTDLWLMLGDNAYNSGTDAEHQTGLFDIFPELLKNTPVWPTMGNHDGYTKQYYGIFDLPTNAQSGGFPSGTEQYYSFDHGNIHFICLNSEEDPPGMIDWLKNDLQTTRADWIIAFFHHGAYTRGSHNSDFENEHWISRGSYLPVLENYGVDLVLSGHSHQYERSHLLDGHYQTSDHYRMEEHAVDPGPGSPLGNTSRQTGIFQYTSEHAPYQKALASLNSGQVSATIGASSRLSLWSTSSNQDRSAITHPDPHPVHVATIRALGSMIIDVDGHTLHASYLDSDGQVRDHFQIDKVLEESPAITWWQDNFGATSYPYLADWFGDADHDSNSNLAEYVHGGDPFKGEQLIEASITIDGVHNGEPGQWYSLQYDLREGTRALVEHSGNLVDFSQSGIETRRLDQPDAQGIARWESRVRRTDNRALFFRLKISR